MAVPVIAVNPAYNVLFNNLSKTVLLSQLVYWDQRKCLQRWGETWFAKTSTDLAEEICHGSAKSVGDWLREFREMGLIKVKRGFFNGVNQLWIQVNHGQLEALLAKFGIGIVQDEPETNLPKTELSADSNLPQTDITVDSKLPQPDVSPPVTYLTGNCISKITPPEIIDQIQRDDEDVVFPSLTQEQIDLVTKRVMAQVNARKMTTSPIRNVQRYLQVALENEAQRTQTTKPKPIDVVDNDDLMGEWKDHFPQNDEVWRGLWFIEDPALKNQDNAKVALAKLAQRDFENSRYGW